MVAFRRTGLAIALTALLAASCGRRPDDIPVTVSVIGPALVEPTAGVPINEPQRVLLGATAQGLVRFDAAGAIEPGLAARWTVIDQGRSIVFRLREGQQPNGRPVTAGSAVAALAAGRRYPGGRSLLAPVREAEAMTPQIVELRLARPVPDLLQRLAQPDFAIRTGGGTGPMRVRERERGLFTLAPAFDPNQPEAVDQQNPAPADLVQLRGESAAMAVARFVRQGSDLVLGGSYRDWALIERLGVANRNVQVDPAHGLFGIAIVNREGFLAEAANREALALAIDAAAVTAAFRREWAATETLLPDPLDLGRPPTRPEWMNTSLAERRGLARARVSVWRARNDGRAPVIRLALPPDWGGNRLWATIGPMLADIGIRVERVASAAEADLRIVDQVAPSDQARWYLETACRPCSAEARDAIRAARDATDPSIHRERLNAAEVALATDHAYIPIARPLRWSLVALRLGRFQTNVRAWHPLDQLRERK